MNFTPAYQQYQTFVAIIDDCVLSVTEETFNWVWCVTIGDKKKQGKADSRQDAEREGMEFIEFIEKV